MGTEGIMGALSHSEMMAIKMGSPETIIYYFHKHIPETLRSHRAKYFGVHVEEYCYFKNYFFAFAAAMRLAKNRSEVKFRRMTYSDGQHHEF